MYSNQGLLAIIRQEVEERRAFRDGSLTLSSLATLCGTNRTYLSEALKPLGGFSAYIGRCRLAYVESWLDAHPGGTLTAALKESGFGSRQSYYNVKKAAFSHCNSSAWSQSLKLQ